MNPAVPCRALPCPAPPRPAMPRPRHAMPSSLQPEPALRVRPNVATRPVRPPRLA